MKYWIEWITINRGRATIVFFFFFFSYFFHFPQNEPSTYSNLNSYHCLPCAEGCDACKDSSPCVAALNWPMRTSILVLACAVIGFLPPAAYFTFRYQQVKVRVFFVVVQRSGTKRTKISQSGRVYCIDYVKILCFIFNLQEITIAWCKPMEPIDFYEQPSGGSIYNQEKKCFTFQCKTIVRIEFLPFASMNNLKLKRQL